MNHFEPKRTPLLFPFQRHQDLRCYYSTTLPPASFEDVQLDIKFKKKK